jgi:hypothetical protein
VLQATASAAAVQKAWHHLYNATYLNPQTASLDLTFLAFNERLRAFASWHLPLVRNPDGRFYGTQLLRAWFESAVDLGTEEGAHRFWIDMAVLVVGAVHFLSVLEEVLVLRQRQGVRMLETVLHGLA